MDKMDKHMLALNKICRLCGNKISCNQKHYNKQQFYSEFGTLYGIELNLDSDNIHPKHICAKDAAVMYRARTAITEGKNFSTQLVPFSFSEHSSNCYVCDTVYTEVKPAGRPKKPKLSQPCIIHLQIQDSKNPLSDPVNKEGPMDTAENTYDCNHVDPEPECFICVSMMMRNVLKSRREEEKIQVFSCFLEKLDYSDMTLLAYVLGKSQTCNIKRDARQFGLLYKDANALSRLKLNDWVSERNEVLRQFMCGVGGLDRTLDETQNDKVIGLTTTIEQVYSLCDERLICPFAFLQSLCIYSLTGSRKTVDLTGKIKPSGCYSSIVNWLLEQKSREPTVADGDLINVFDNEQVIGFKSAIKPKHKAKVSIITNKGYLIFDGNGDLQKEQSFKPPQILKLDSLDQGTVSTTKDVFEEAVKDMIDGKSDIYERHKSIHYEQLYYFVENAIKVVSAEQHKNNTSISDSVDQTVKETQTEELYITCCSCGTKNLRRKIVCIGCNSKEGIKMARHNTEDPNSDQETPKHTSFCKIQFETKADDSIEITTTFEVETSENERYDHVKSNHCGRKELVLTDPVFCNPNSFESVALVLRQIGIENGIKRYGGSRRHWTFICCDGVPYLICKKLKEEAVICAIDNCSDSFLSKKDYHNHFQNVHSEAPECKYVYEFDWFYLRIGAGHYEMNLVKSFFELNWIPFIETLCEEMGFSSDTAKLFAKNCKDHHKSWYLLVIFHLAVLRELAVPYVRECMRKQINEITAKGFFKFWNELYQDNPTLQYLMDQVCRMSQGIINFRMAIRRNNSCLMHSAKFMTKELFYIRNHPKYQNIESFDHLQYLLMPANVQLLSDRNVSVTTSGNSSSGEDLDFILEEKNRQLKQWISKGIPTDEFWQTVCRNNNILEDLKSNVYGLLGLDAGETSPKEVDIDSAVHAFRVVLRRSNYVGRNNTCHVSISGQMLDKELVNCITAAEQKRKCLLMRSFLQDQTDDDPILKMPAPVTQEERAKLEDVTCFSIQRLEQEILRTIQEIENPEIRRYYENNYHRNIKGCKKAKYVEYVLEIRNTLTEGRNDSVFSATIDNANENLPRCPDHGVMPITEREFQTINSD